MFSAIDELVASGRASRAAVIVEAIDRLVADLESERIDREIVEGYTARSVHDGGSTPGPSGRRSDSIA